MYGCAFLAFLFFVFFLSRLVPIYSKAFFFFFSGSGQRLVFLITFFSFTFFFRGCLSQGGSSIFTSALMGSIRFQFLFGAQAGGSAGLLFSPASFCRVV